MLLPMFLRSQLRTKLTSALFWQLASGLILFAFITSHLLNHMLGLISLDAMEWGRSLFLGVWRSIAGSAVLIAACLSHIVLTLRRLAQRRTRQGIRFSEYCQLILGLLIPLFIADHVIGTRVSYQLYSTHDSYYAVLVVLWVLAPIKGILQVVATLIAWTHGCLGIYFWLRLKSWAAKLTPFLPIVATLIPVLALLGFVEGAREAAIRVAAADDLAALMDASGYRQDGVAESLATISRNARIIMLVGFLILLASLALQAWRRRRYNIINLHYPGGQSVKIPLGSSVLEASRAAHIMHVSICGGRGRCSTCRIRVSGPGVAHLDPPNNQEKQILDRIKAPASIRLACQLRPRTDLDISPLLATPPSQYTFTDPDQFAYGRDRDIAILFADLYDFTQFTETKLPYDVVFILNRYFQHIREAILNAEGRIDKFIGDGVMALFGVVRGVELGCHNVFASLAELAEAMHRLNIELATELHQPLRLRVGIHAGPTIVGNVGHGDTAGLTAIGDTVNVTSRLEALNKIYDSEVMISARAAKIAKIDVSAFDHHETTIRGQSQPIEVYSAAKLDSFRTLDLWKPPQNSNNLKLDERKPRPAPAKI